MFSQGSPENIIVSSFALFHGNNNNRYLFTRHRS
nr:MAG TPA: hypothetical protein [Caudoviricetes sp.]